MRWRGGRQSDNVEDVRGTDGGGGFGRGGGLGGGPMRIPIGRMGGGGGISGIIILVVLFFVLRACGIDPLEILSQMNGGAPGQVSTEQVGGGTQTGGLNDESKQFVSTVLAETEDVWSGIFQAQGQQYQPPKLVLFSGRTQSGCGTASMASGPFYCPNDQKVYLDTSFFDQLANQFGAAGDFANAYVIAHEVGHHVQNLLGILPKFNQARQSMNEGQANQMSVRVELQADCYAGIWAHFTEQKGTVVEAGDIDAALNAAEKIGDDTLQKKTQGYVVPDSFTHGSSAQRKQWFSTGYKSGKLASCDTFTNPQ